MRPKGTNILACLPKTSSMISFVDPKLPSGTTGGNDRRADHITQKANWQKGLSGPKIIPVVARVKTAKADEITGLISSLPQEPTSPKVSCLGQIKIKKKIEDTEVVHKNFRSTKSDKRKMKLLSRIFTGGTKVIIAGNETVIKSDEPPVLGEMKRFSSRRQGELFTSLDFSNVQDSSEDHENKVENVDSREYDPIDNATEDSCNGVCSHLSRLNVVLEPRKEVNLWDRRAMAKPTPLLSSC